MKGPSVGQIGGYLAWRGEHSEKFRTGEGEPNAHKQKENLPGRGRTHVTLGNNREILPLRAHGGRGGKD